MVQRTPKHSMRYIIGLMAITATLLGWSGCKNDPGQGNHTDPPKNPVEVKQIDVSFNADSAYAFVAKQVSFGPRIPGSGAHVAAMQYLKTKLESYCDTVYINHGDIRKKDETKVIVNNIVGSFNPASTNRVVLAAHYDTRPMADEDPENPTTPADGANDGKAIPTEAPPGPVAPAPLSPPAGSGAGVRHSPPRSTPEAGCRPER